IPFFSSLIAFAVQWILKLLIWFLSFVENLPFAVAEFTLSITGLVLLSAMLLSLFLFIETRNKKYFRITLLFLALLAATSFVIETRSLLRIEIIVYNQPEHVVVHLIRGKRNYVITDEKLPESGCVQNTIQSTVRKMRLHNPIFLQVNQKYHDNYFFIKNGLLVF